MNAKTNGRIVGSSGTDTSLDAGLLLNNCYFQSNKQNKSTIRSKQTGVLKVGESIKVVCREKCFACSH